jgi:uncharacterized membrane protein
MCTAMDLPYIAEIIRLFALAFGIFGAILIIYGGIQSIFELILMGLHRKNVGKGQVMRKFTGYIVFGLEFFIAGDVLTTLLNPTIEDLTLLGAVVLIRVILGYFLQKESKEFDIDS